MVYKPTSCSQSLHCARCVGMKVIGSHRVRGEGSLAQTRRVHGLKGQAC